MTYKENVVRGSVRSEHFVQLFDSPESLAQSVCAHLAPAYEAGHNLLVVARPRHWDAIARKLKSQGCDIVDGLKTNRVVVLDALTTARAISRGDMPDASRFDDIVARLVYQLSQSRGLAIYGEMVELFAEEGNFTAALKLEELWNALAEKTSFRLMCGYSSAHFASPSSEGKLRDVCKAHTHVQTKSDDSLAAWLVQRTRLPFRAELLNAS